MLPFPVSSVLVMVLSLTATLPGPTVVHARGNSVAERYTQLYDLMNTRLNKFETLLNRIDSRLDGIEAALPEAEAFDCNVKPCQNNGTCSVSGESCICPAGYDGDFCQNVNCIVKPCQNDGNCSVRGDICTCPYGYGGDFCHNVDCYAKPCQNDGTCSVNDESCTCPPGYEGDFCQDVNCNRKSCHNDGTCSVSGDTCTCPYGYRGDFCQHFNCTRKSCHNEGTCSVNGDTCTCPPGYGGDFCQNDGGCQDALVHGMSTSGVHTTAADSNNPINVYCEQALDGGGWTVFQVRYNGSVDFYQNWTTYKTGFGSLQGEFWLGNENIHQLTKNHDYELKIELTSNKEEVLYAGYMHFWLEDEAQKYKITVSGFKGGYYTPPGDSMGIHNGHEFSTLDQDNDGSPEYDCAELYTGAWWYDHCHNANLNGKYGNTEQGQGLNWFTWKGGKESMKATRMMMRRKP